MIDRAIAATKNEKKPSTDVKRKRPGKILVASDRGGRVYKISAVARIEFERTAKNIVVKKKKQAAKAEADADAMLAEFIEYFGD